MKTNTLHIERLFKLNQLDKKQIQELFTAYQEELGLDLCFQGFAEELKGLPGVYAEPEGAILVSRLENEIVGVVALKQLEPGICEMKRLYIKPEQRGQSMGQKLVSKIIEIGKEKDYKTMKLDSLEKLKPAIALYERFGFQRVDAYNYNPDETVVYYALSL